MYIDVDVYRYTKNHGREFGCRVVVLFLQSQLSSSCVVGMYMYVYKYTKQPVWDVLYIRT